jgi:hypothetical protein
MNQYIQNGTNYFRHPLSLTAELLGSSTISTLMNVCSYLN